MNDRESKFVSMAAFEALRERLALLERNAERRDGTSKGLTQGWAALVAVVGLAATGITIVVLLRGNP